MNLNLIEKTTVKSLKKYFSQHGIIIEDSSGETVLDIFIDYFHEVRMWEVFPDDDVISDKMFLSIGLSNENLILCLSRYFAFENWDEVIEFDLILSFSKQLSTSFSNYSCYAKLLEEEIGVNDAKVELLSNDENGLFSLINNRIPDSHKFTFNYNV